MPQPLCQAKQVLCQTNQDNSGNFLHGWGLRKIWTKTQQISDNCIQEILPYPYSVGAVLDYNKFYIIWKFPCSLSFYRAQNHHLLKWAVTWQNQQSDCAPSEDSDQSGHPPSLIRDFAVRMKKAWVISYPLSAQRRLWSDWADAQADLSLRWVHTHFVGFVMSWLKWKKCIWWICTCNSGTDKGGI